MLQGVSWTDGKCSMPTSCPVSECRSRTFAARRNHLLTETIDWQSIRYVNAACTSALIQPFYRRLPGFLRQLAVLGKSGRKPLWKW